MNLESYDAGHFNRGAPRWKEAIWVVVKTLFFLTPCPAPSRFRVALLRWFGAEIGGGVVIRSRVNVTFPWRVKIGDHCWIGEEVLILSLARVEIGSHVCISQRAFLCTGSHRFDREDFALETKPIRIGDRCWIAAQAFIAPGVEIGDGTMVCAGSVVTRSLPEGCAAQGNPAVVVK